jgi:signal transduction histidine kinase
MDRPPGAAGAAASDPSLPIEVKVALYRIAQEALNNVLKHATASRALVRLSVLPAAGMAGRGGPGVELQVCDDGRGFDLSDLPAGHFGVGIMRERAAAVGAEIEIHSEPGQGTQITVRWPDGRAPAAGGP